MPSMPEPVAPEIFTLNPNHPDVALATISRYIIAQINDLRDNTVSVDDLAMGMAALAQLASTFFSALDSSVADRKQLNDRVAALEAKRATLAAKSVALPLLAIGSTDVTVTWGQNLGDASYQVEVLLPAALIGKVTATVKTTYATSCVITLRSTLAVSLGQSLDAIAFRYS